MNLYHKKHIQTIPFITIIGNPKVDNANTILISFQNSCLFLSVEMLTILITIVTSFIQHTTLHQIVSMDLDQQRSLSYYPDSLLLELEMVLETMVIPMV